MTPDFQKAHIAGVERIAAWSDVLDRNALLGEETPAREAPTKTNKEESSGE